MNKRILMWMLAIALLQGPSVWADPLGETQGPVESAVVSPIDAGRASEAEKVVANLAIAMAFVPRPDPDDGPPLVPEDVNGIPLDAIREAQELEDALNAELDPENIPIEVPITPEDPIEPVPDPMFTDPTPDLTVAAVTVAAIPPPAAPAAPAAMAFVPRPPPDGGLPPPPIPNPPLDGPNPWGYNPPPVPDGVFDWYPYKYAYRLAQIILTPFIPLPPLPPPDNSDPGNPPPPPRE